MNNGSCVMGCTEKQQNADSLYRAIGRAIAKARQANGMTQNELAGRLNLTRASITNIEAGRQRLLVHTLLDIAQVLSLPVAQLLPKLQNNKSLTSGLEIRGNVDLNDSERTHVFNVIRDLSEHAD